MIKALVVGYGNIGKSVIETLKVTKDFEIVGIVRREGGKPIDGIPVLTDITGVECDVAILCTPSRSVPKEAEYYLSKGICTVDSYDIHSSIYELKMQLDEVCKKNGTKAIISAGWDPGSDSIVRALMQSCAPKGVTYTNFGAGMSMGHTVAVKAIKGVKSALSMTIPLGTGIHRRMVYIELEDGYDEKQVTAQIKSDPYFVNDETHVTVVPNVDDLIDMGHGVNMVRKGVSGTTQNQRFEFNMSINNPALTAQNLVNCARAVLKQQSGAYTMIEIPVIDFLYGDKEELIRHIV
ncbi:MAG: diaminopimelate dehydrogenase [Oscillospiraceae bacterium]